MDKICEQVAEIAENETGVSLTEKESLKESGVDSLTLVAIIVALEENYQITFSEDDLQPENLQTLEDLANLVRKYL